MFNLFNDVCVVKQWMSMQNNVACGLRSSIYSTHGKVNSWVQGHVLIIEKISCDVVQSEGVMLKQIESHVHACMHF